MDKKGIASCKLCLQSKELRASHILPEFLYKEAYDSKHRMIYMVSEAGNRDKYLQKGVREPLLCQDCETRFSRHERYAATVLRELRIGPLPPGAFIRIEGIDYAAFKLFLMSLLWRAGVAEHPMFSTVNLGPHAERLRSLLLVDSAGEPHEYGCFVEVVRDLKDLRALVRTPYRLRLEAHIVYCFVFFGLFWYYVASSHSAEFPSRRLFLEKDGTLRIRVANTTEDEIVRDFVAELKESGRL